MYKIIHSCHINSYVICNVYIELLEADLGIGGGQHWPNLISFNINLISY